MPTRGLDGDQAGISALEASLVVPATLLVEGRELLDPTDFNVGIGDDNWIIGLTGGCLRSGEVAVLRYTVRPLAEGESSVCLEIC